MRLSNKTKLASLLLFCGIISASVVWFFNAYNVPIDKLEMEGGGSSPWVVWPKYDPSHIDDWQVAPAEPVFMYPHVANPAPRIREYLESGYQLRGNPLIKLDGPINWSNNPRNDRNWQFKVNSWDMLVPFLNRYKIDKNSQYLEIAESVM